MSTSITRLQISKFIKAKPESVFEAWTRPELMKLWFCPENLKPGAIETDVRIGGKFRGTMIGEEETFTASGIYTDIVPNQKLVFTHGWEGPERVETLVTVEFKPRDGGTELTLTHERLDPDSADGHQEGWTSSLDNLARYLS